ncbi:hypothetical protein BDZ45DRAFT_735952 [Acephala macrosclerotiorum]|nr:hypothetical protein BDZ45DRAFT_735952 [Acephala macrosclerotiorum]
MKDSHFSSEFDEVQRKIKDKKAYKPIRTSSTAMRRELNFASTGEPITFHVGEVADHPADFACQVSPVWKKALNGPFLEGQTSTYDLSDVSPRIFQLLIRWIYTRDLGIEPSPTFESFPIEYPNKRTRLQNEMDDQDMDLACLWVLAERLMIPRLQNVAMRLLHQRRENCSWEIHDTKVFRKCTSLYQPSSHWILYVFDNTNSRSDLRRFAVHQAVFFLDAETFEKFPDRFPKELLLDLARYVTHYRWLKRDKLGPLTTHDMCGSWCSADQVVCYPVKECED